MQTNQVVSRKARIGGRIASGLVAAFLLWDSAMKLLELAPAVKGTQSLGFSPGSVLPIGVVELACVVLYLIPRTAVLGAVLLTGYLGGAVATHARFGAPLLSHTLFPIYIGAIAWIGLLLRQPRVRTLVLAFWAPAAAAQPAR